jgi:Tfp pilus assembly protein PilF
LHALATLKYTDAILLTVARIAEGLQHAHERGLVHQDLKPANILITDEGLPLILDFNLAHDMRPDAQMLRAQVGGTLPYMSPEQLVAFRDKTGAGSIDGRSDLYSLGLILFQLLAGQRPYFTPYGSFKEMVEQMIEDRQTPAPDVREYNPEVEPGIASIVAHCLQADPARRYQSAAELVEDIQRHRANLPLKYAANWSLSERVLKWARRHPQIASPSTVLAAMTLLTLGVVGMGARSAMANHRQEFHRLQQVGRNLVLNFDHKRTLAEHYLSAHADQVAWCDKGQELGFEALQSLGVFDSPDWTARPEFQALTPEEKQSLRQRTDHLAQLLIFVDARQAVIASSSETRNQRIAKLKDTLLGAQLPQSQSAYLHAVELQNSGKHREAIAVLQPYLQAHPEEVNAWFVLGRSQYMRGQMAEAFHAFSTCVALKPEFAPGYYNRALTSLNQGLDPVPDLDRALKWDPDFVEARTKRAYALMYRSDLQAALEDINHVLEAGHVNAQRLLLRSEILRKQGFLTLAHADRSRALGLPCNDPYNQMAVAWYQLEVDPRAALASYRAAEKMAPGLREPLLHQSYIYGEVLNKPAEAIDCLNRLLKYHPQDVDSLCGRAVYLARLSRTDESVAEIRRVLQHYSDPFTYYRVSCAYALLAQHKPEYKAQALRYVTLALEGGEGIDYLLEDPDLQTLQDEADFQILAEAVRLMRATRDKPERF